MKKTYEINFDMDGTFVNLYGVDGWLEMLRNEDATPYLIARPLVRMCVFARLLNRLQKQGYKINIISWLAKNGSVEYNSKVTEAKKAWLKKHLPSVKWDQITIVSYGTPKENCGCGVLFDDEKRNRETWNGVAYDVCNMLEVLRSL